MARSPKSRQSGFQKLASLRLELLARLSARHAEIDYRAKVGLSFLQCRVLGIVGSNGEMSFKNVCRETGIEKSHASRIVASLIELKLFQKANDPDDQRSILLKLTAKGKKVHKQVLLVAVDRNDRWLKILAPDQRQVFLDCIELLTQQARKLAARTKSPRAETRAKAGVRTGATPSGKGASRPAAVSKIRQRS